MDRLLQWAWDRYGARYSWVIAVNVAARVEQLTKATGDAILLTYRTVDALSSRPPGLAELGSHPLKGKSAEVRVFALQPPA